MERSLRDAIAARDRFTCQSCGRHTRGQVHHIVPRREGGSDLPDNLMTLCGPCHMLVSPIPLHVLKRVLRMSEQQILAEKARVEMSIQSWVLAQPLTQAENCESEQAPQQAWSVPEWKRLRPRAGTPWSSEDDCTLLADFDAGLSLEEIAHRQGRGVFAVEVRLCKLGRIATSKS